MNKPKPIPAKGTTTYDILGMNDEEFERLLSRLVRLEHPTAIKPANTSDGGADLVLPAGGPGYSRCWQAKHYPKNIHWGKCEKSLNDAREHWNPEHYTFVFPRELTVGEQKTFDKKFGGLDIVVDQWNGEELQARLRASEGGKRVAKDFFDDIGLERERTNQAIEAAGRLETPQDAAARLQNIGAFLSKADSYFAYPASVHDEGGSAPGVAAGAVMSYAESDGQVRSRVDIVPRDEEAMDRYGPEFALAAQEGEAGRRAAERLQAALSRGEAVEIDDGIDVTFTRMPPAFEDMVGQRLTGKVILGPSEQARSVPPWKAHLRATSTEGVASLDVDLEPVATPPDGWDAALTGQVAGLTVTAMLRQRAGRGELSWNFNYQRASLTVAEQVEALRFMHVVSAAGEIVVTDSGGSGRPELRMPTPEEPLAAPLGLMLTFLEDVRVIEQWADVQYDIPGDITFGVARKVAELANIIRNGGRGVTWSKSDVTIPTENVPVLRRQGVMRVEHRVGTNIFGRTVALGLTQLEITGYQVVEEHPATGKPGFSTVRIEPSSEEHAKAFERLVKQPTNAGKAPPPSPLRKRKPKKKPKRKSHSGRRKR